MNQEKGDKVTNNLKLWRFGMGKLTKQYLDNGFGAFPTMWLHGAVGIVTNSTSMWRLLTTLRSDLQGQLCIHEKNRISSRQILPDLE